MSDFEKEYRKNLPFAIVVGCLLYLCAVLFQPVYLIMYFIKILRIWIIKIFMSLRKMWF